MNFVNSFVTQTYLQYNTINSAILVANQGVVVEIMNNIICVCIYICTYKVHIIQELVHNKDIYMCTTCTLISFMHSMGLIG